MMRASLSSKSSNEFSDLKMELYDYQKAGIEYAIKSRACIIGDDMGLGKTVQSIVTVNETSNYPCLIVTLASIKEQWKSEIKDWIKPKRSVVILSGKRQYNLPTNNHFYILNYEILHAWIDYLLHVEFKSMILDESQLIKSPTSERSVAARKIASTIRKNKKSMIMCLTGTPIEIKPIEIITQLEAIGMLDYMGGYQKFRSTYCWDSKSYTYNGAKNLEHLNQKMRKRCYIRREKSQVLKDLPSKRRYFINLSLNEKYVKEYMKIERDFKYWFRLRAQQLTKRNNITFSEAYKKVATESIEAAQRLSALRQVSAMSKVESVINWLNNQDEKIVVFTFHREITTAIYNSTNSSIFIGGLTQGQRDDALLNFLCDENKHIICSIRAAGVGIDGLQDVSSCALFVEQDYNPAKLEQAEDRIYRSGQKNPVLIQYVYSDLSVDRSIFKLLKARKKTFNDAVIGNDIAYISEEICQ